MIQRAVQLLAVAGLLAMQVGCLEGFEKMITRVVYDPFVHEFQVERRLVNLDASFFGCEDVDACMLAVDRALAGRFDPTVTPSLAERLVKRLLETGAVDVSIRLEQDGDALHLVSTYTAPLGTRAADDTMVHAEFRGRSSTRGSYRLVIAAQPSMDPPRGRHTVRKQSTSGASGVDWRASWVLPARKYDVSTTMQVDGAVQPLFAGLPDLAARLADAGWLGAPLELGAAAVAALPLVPAATPPPAVADAAEEQEETPVPPEEPAAVEPSSEAQDARPVVGPVEEVAPEEIPAAPAPEPEPAVGAGWPAPDPDSPARVFRHESRVAGPVAVAAADRSALPLQPLVEVCYQQRQAVRPELGGFAFLSVVVRGDGFVVSTSVYGEVDDPPLLSCLEEVLALWRPPVPTVEEAVAEVSIPYTFRVEEGRKGRRRAR